MYYYAADVMILKEFIRMKEFGKEESKTGTVDEFQFTWPLVAWDLWKE